jgi:hypothetical protein
MRYTLSPYKASIDFYLNKKQTEKLIASCDEWWTNPHSGVKLPQYYVTVDGKKYLIDLWEETGEMVSINDVELMQDKNADSDMADILDMREWLELCIAISEELDK